MRCGPHSHAGCRRRPDVEDQPIIDRARLELITRGDRRLAEEFLGALCDEADQLLERLSVLIAGDDPTAVADAAHTLKGMASELGAMRLRAAAVDLEGESEARRWPKRVEDVRAALAELKAWREG
jgi:HPt (histidine-containing phosphotransfer) domain-containing protein